MIGNAFPTIAEVLRWDADLYEKKAKDYAPDPSDPFENVRFASLFATRAAGGTGNRSTPGMVLASLLGVKIARLMTIGWATKANNESFIDTLRDLRIYSAMLEVYLRSHDYEKYDPETS